MTTISFQLRTSAFLCADQQHADSPQRDSDHCGVLTCYSYWSQHPWFPPSGTSRADVDEEEQTKRPTKNAVITLSKKSRKADR